MLALLNADQALTESQLAALQLELDERNRALAPLLYLGCIAHLANLWTLWPTAAQRMDLSPNLLTWHWAQVGLSSTAAVFLAVLAVALKHYPSGCVRYLIFTLASYSMLHGALVAGVDQLHVPTISIFLAYSLLQSTLFALRPLPALGVYLIGAASFSVAIVQFQSDELLRTTLLWQGMSGLTLGAALAVLAFRARRHEFVQRTTIAHQQKRLENLNRTLEQRVKNQVDELTARAEQVNQLNGQLRAQINTRTRQLTSALQQLTSAPSITPNPSLGAVVGQRFKLVRQLGSGGMGDVYEAIDQQTGNDVALKFVRTDRRVERDDLRRFLQEADVMASLNHAAIVRMLQVDITDKNTLYQVQELVHGLPLSSILRTFGPLPVEMVIRLLSTLSEALIAAHAKDIVHRDVKPSNIMLTDFHPGLKLLDFGIAKVLSTMLHDKSAIDPAHFVEPPTSLHQITDKQLVVGTLGFIAPETRMGMHTTPRSDIYALSMVGYLALCGSLPRFGVDVVIPGKPSPYTTPLLGLLETCASIDPEQRLSAQALHERLTALIAPDSGQSLQSWVQQLGLLDTLDGSPRSRHES